MRQGALQTRSKEFRIVVGLAVLAVIGAVTAGILAGRHSGQALADAAPVSAFVNIQDVTPNVVTPKAGRAASTGVFAVDCGTNGNRKLSPDNPVAQPGIKNGAQHVHDFVGNLSITADSTDATLENSGTTCRNGDKSSYFWPVVRINRQANVSSAVTNADTLKAAGPASISCPTVADKLPAVPTQARAEVDRNLALLDTQIAEANQRLFSTQGQGGANFVNNAILGPLSDKRAATLDRIAIAIGRVAAKPTNLASLADCELSFDHAGHNHGGGSTASSSPTGGSSSAPVVVTPTVNCPTVRDKLSGVPAQAVDEVNRNLDLLDKQIAEANQRLVTSQGQGGANFIQNAILGPLKDKRVATLNRIATAIGRVATKPTGLDALAPCTLNNAGGNAGGGNTGGGNTGNGGGAASPAPSAASPAPSAAAELPGVQGPNLELAGNIGNILRPASVKIEYRGNPTTKVVPMPKFLKALTGDAKPGSRGLANTRATWTCSGFTNRLSDKYVICPAGSQVMRVSDFPSCWDGVNTDSANHRTHILFPDKTTGACPAGTKAVPQVRITIAYNIPVSIQKAGQYQLDSFPEENHNPISDHNDFENVNSVQTMARIANCINTGRRCR
jgi:hypothetical protein